MNYLKRAKKIRKIHNDLTWNEAKVIALEEIRKEKELREMDV